MKEGKVKGFRLDVKRPRALTGRARCHFCCSTSREIGVAMLRFAVETALASQVEEPHMLSTERLALEMGLLNMDRVSLSSPEMTKTSSELDVSASSAGDSDSLADRANNPLQNADGVTKIPHHAFIREEHLLHVLSFLPWRCVLQLRVVNKQFLRLSLSFVTVCRLPQSRKLALFIPCQEDLVTNEIKVEAELDRGRRPSVCQQCGLLLNYCSNYLKPCCQLSQYGGERIFVGQLRRDGTVPMIKWLLLSVLGMPRDSLLSAENHRNKSSSHGKGCAWVVLQESAVAFFLNYHHRVFFDNVQGVEGVWLVPPACKRQLAILAQNRGSALDRPKHMPRNMLVVEMPLSVPPPVSTYWTRTRTRVMSQTPRTFLFPSHVPLSTYTNTQKQLRSWRHDPYANTIVFSPFFPQK